MAVVTYFVYNEIGPTAFVGTALILIQIPFQYFLGRIFIKLRFTNHCNYSYYQFFRLSAAKLTDKRILIMNEIISGIRVIKMYGWEYAFHTLVANIRK